MNIILCHIKILVLYRRIVISIKSHKVETVTVPQEQFPRGIYTRCIMIVIYEMVWCVALALFVIKMKLEAVEMSFFNTSLVIILHNCMLLCAVRFTMNTYRAISLSFVLCKVYFIFEKQNKWCEVYLLLIAFWHAKTYIPQHKIWSTIFD